MINELLKELSNIEKVEAIAIGGSRATNNHDEKSDYDIYLYCSGSIDENIRKSLLEKYCSYIEISNKFWELEDNCTLKNGIDIDILYRNLDDFTNGLINVVEEFNSYNGYTTCMWHNLLNCKIIYDKYGRLKETQDRFNIPYPKELKDSIINRNIRLIHNSLPAYNLQIKKALNRGDIVSINHRTAAFMESYFDIIFAVNELTHPGEKRLVKLVKETCKIVPNNFEENINELYTNLYNNKEKANNILENIIVELEKIL